MHLRELSRLPVSVAVSAVIAAFAATWSVADVSLAPPRLTPRALEIASAETQIVVDTPYSTVVDLRQGVSEIEPLTKRTLLIGTLMSTPTVRADIARRAQLPPERLLVHAPRTPEQPRPPAQSGEKKGPADLLKTTDQYRLDIKANPTIPLLSITAQAPTPAEAERLANAAVSGVRDYVERLATSQRTPDDVQVQLRQLGEPRGEVVNRGIQPQVAFVVFLLVFALSCVASVFIARVRRGWRMALATEG